MICGVFRLLAHRELAPILERNRAGLDPSARLVSASEGGPAGSGREYAN